MNFCAAWMKLLSVLSSVLEELVPGHAVFFVSDLGRKHIFMV